MWNLNYSRYSPVWCKEDAIGPWFLCDDVLPRLKQNAAYVRQIKDNHSVERHVLTILNNLARQEVSVDHLSDEESIQELGLSSIGVPSGSFINKQHYSDFYSEAKMLLATEKFCAPDIFYSGSSRHANLYDIQLKGIGRNSLVNDFEYHHSWGGLTSFDAFKGLLSGIVVNQRTMLKELEVLGLFLYRNHLCDGLPQAVVARSMDSFRLAHCWPDQMTNEEKLEIRKHLAQMFPGLSLSEIQKNIAIHYTNAFHKGVLHRSPTLDNLLVDGRWIDSESLDFTLNGSQYPFFLQVFYPDDKKEIRFQKNEYLTDISIKHTGLLYGSWVHHLQKCIKAHYLFFQALDKKEALSDFNQDFSNTLLELSSCDRTYWETVRKKYSCYTDWDYKRELTRGLSPFTDTGGESLKDFRAQEIFYDSHLKGWVLYFSPIPDPHHECMNFVKRMFSMYLPQYHDIQKAQLNFKSLCETLRPLK